MPTRAVGKTARLMCAVRGHDHLVQASIAAGDNTPFAVCMRCGSVYVSDETLEALRASRDTKKEKHDRQFDELPG